MMGFLQKTARFFYPDKLSQKRTSPVLVKAGLPVIEWIRKFIFTGILRRILNFAKPGKVTNWLCAILAGDTFFYDEKQRLSCYLIFYYFRIDKK